MSKGQPDLCPDYKLSLFRRKNSNNSMDDYLDSRQCLGEHRDKMLFFALRPPLV